MKTLIRFLINFTATAVIILIFRHIEWLEFINPPKIFTDNALNDILTGGIIGFIMFVIGELAGVAFGALVIITCGLGCLLYPIFGILLGYIKLLGTQIILPDWFLFTPVWWKVTIISMSVGLFRIPSIKEQKKIIIKEKTKS